MPTPGIDTVALLTRCLQNRALAADLLRLFVEHVPVDVRHLTEAVHRRDGPAAGSLAHRLKGTAATVSADVLHQCVLGLERRIKASDWPAAMAAVTAVTLAAEACLKQIAEDDPLGQTGD